MSYLGLLGNSKSLVTYSQIRNIRSVIIQQYNICINLMLPCILLLLHPFDPSISQMISILLLHMLSACNCLYNLGSFKTVQPISL